jgi:TM2 domain-containing membrane protein YozV
MGDDRDERPVESKLPSVIPGAPEPPPFDRPEEPPLPTDSQEPPPHLLDGKWQVSINREIFGPYSGHQIKTYIEDGRVTRSTGVLRAGNIRWKAAADDHAFRDFFPSRSQVSASSTVTVGKDDFAVQINNNVVAEASIIAPPTMNTGKSPGLAALLSFLIPGVGQIYNGEVVKGILMFFGSALLWYFYLGWTVWIWSMVDAYMVAQDSSGSGITNYHYRRRITGRRR